MGERSAGIDALRVVGMGAIVASHVWLADAQFLWLMTWPVPLFFLLSGYLSTGRRSIRDEIVQRAQTLLLPYAIWLLVIGSITYTIRGEFPLREVRHNLWGGVFLESPFWAFWFAPALFVAAVLHRMIRPLPLVGQWAIAVAALAVVVYIPGKPLVYLPLCIAQGASALVFVLAGRSLRLLNDRLSRPTLLGVGLLALGVAAGFASSTGYIDIRLLQFGVPVASVVTAGALAGGLILVAESTWRLRGVPAAVVTALAAASLCVMYVHVPIIVALDGFWSGSATVFLFTVVVSWVIALVVLWLPGGWVFSGVRRDLLRVSAPAEAA